MTTTTSRVLAAGWELIQAEARWLAAAFGLVFVYVNTVPLPAADLRAGVFALLTAAALGGLAAWAGLFKGRSR